MWKVFWAWYERTYILNVSIALSLFLLQIAHLVWLFGEVVWAKAFGVPLFSLSAVHQLFIILVDYTEIPALISVSFVYINELRSKWGYSALVYLLFLNLQWLHLFWISDEFVVASLIGSVPVALPLWLAWVAIIIDYLEVPVMVDLVKRFIKASTEGKVGEFLKHDLRGANP
ncbi:MAG: Uncharacterized protein G01um10148_626 [Parcubacteria group bacterium Gr01-1014_8]|nr:MAG: Uncharacterized protein G01um10148_626 [Parcubacteria group bacterium Gr01-1014_8]